MLTSLSEWRDPRRFIRFDHVGLHSTALSSPEKQYPRLCVSDNLYFIQTLSENRLEFFKFTAWHSFAYPSLALSIPRYVKKKLTTFCPSFGFWTTCCIRLNFLGYAQHIGSCFSAYSNHTLLLAVCNKTFIGNSLTKSLYLLSNLFGLTRHTYRNT